MTSTRPNHGAVSLDAAVLAAFFVSGACGLIHQVAWMRLLRHVMGNTTLSVTTVLCAFMGGLALGSYGAGRRIDRRKDPLRVFGALEIGIGLYAATLPWLIHAARPLYGALYRGTENSFYLLAVVRFAFSAAILLVPATLMGASLPVLARFFVRSAGRAGGAVGRLYAINTFGAVLGCVAAGFVLLPRIGVSATIWFASAWNVLAGVAALWAHRRAPAPGVAPLDAVEVRPSAATPGSGRVPLVWTVLLGGYALAGAAALVYEVAWTRALSLLVGSSVYAFTLMLTAFILGIGLGSAAFVKRVDRIGRPWVVLAALQAGIGLTALAVVPLIERLPFALTGWISRTDGGFWRLQALEFGCMLLVMLVPTTLMGASFPLAARLAIECRGAAGHSVGTLYGANTLGSILGAFAGGFLLIPWLGLQGTIFAAVAFNLAAAAALSGCAPSSRRALRYGLPLATLGVAALAMIAMPRWDPSRLSFGPFLQARNLPPEQARSPEALARLAGEGEIVFHDEGLAATVTVRRDADGELTLLVGGVKEAGSTRGLRQQTMLAHIPMLLHPDPRRVLVIGLASGVTLGAAGRHPADKLDVVEISSGVVEATRLFTEANHGILDDPRVELILGDGRNHLTLTDREYDVIISQPSTPWTAGVADLFTREFFGLLGERLVPGGVACVWIETASLDLDTLRSVIRTFDETFEYAALWGAARRDLLLIGAAEAPTVDVRRLGARVSDSVLARDFSRVAVANIPEFLGMMVAGPRGVAALGAGARIHTDDNALLEFAAPLRVSRNRAEPALLLAVEEHRRGDFDFLRSGAQDAAALQLVRERAAEIVELTGQRTRAHLLAGEGRWDEAAAAFAEVLRLRPDDVQALFDRGRALEFGGRPIEAAAAFREVLALAPDHADARAHLAATAAIAATASTPTDGLGEDPAAAHHDAALQLHAAGRLAEAVARYRASLALRPDFVEAHANLGVALAMSGDTSQALEHLREAVRLDPERPATQQALARALVSGREPSGAEAAEAVAAAERAVRLGGENALRLATLAEAYGAAGNDDDARRVSARALALAEDEGNDPLAEVLRKRLQTPVRRD